MDEIYHVSKSNLNNKILVPRIPINYFTKNNYEDNTTKRVCFSKTIEGALMGLGMVCDGHEFYVHVPLHNYDYYIPKVTEVPDSKITKEVWVLNTNVQIKCIGKVRAFDKGKDGIPFCYKDTVTSVYELGYYWLERY